MRRMLKKTGALLLCLSLLAALSAGTAAAEYTEYSEEDDLETYTEEEPADEGYPEDEEYPEDEGETAPEKETGAAAEKAPVTRSAETQALLEEFTLTHGDRNSPKVAITVDDCWANSTKHLNRIIDLCEQYKIPVTFFALDLQGCLHPKHREMWQRALDAGCEIGCHYYNHIFMGSRDNWTIIDRLGKWQEDLDNTLGYHYQTRWLRPPFGNIEDQHISKRSTQRMTKVIKIFGFDHIVRWDVSETVADKAVTKVENGCIMLFHGKNKDVKCLETLIPWLLENGYQPVTVSELFGYDPPETSAELYVYNKADYEGK